MNLKREVCWLTLGVVIWLALSGCRPSSSGEPPVNFSEAYLRAGERWQALDTPLHFLTDEERDEVIDEVIALYTQALEEEPNLTSAYVNRGLAYAERQWYEQAIADFSLALEQQPHAADALKNRGLVYEQMGDLEKAIADYDLFLTLIEAAPTARRERERELFTEKLSQLRDVVGG